MERHNIAADALADTHWKKADPSTFAELWTRELEAVPEFTESRFHVMTGLLLPIWKRLPEKNPRVYRFQTDEGERVIGRLIPPEFVDAFAAQTTPLTPEEASSALNQGRGLALAGGLALRRVMVMHAPRIELTGFDAEDIPNLKTKGLIGEIISWKLRLFVPMNGETPTILGKIFAAHPLVERRESEAYALAEKNGMKIYEVTPDEVAECRVCSSAVVDGFMSKSGELGRRLMEAYGQLRTQPCCSAGTPGVFTRR